MGATNVVCCHEFLQEWSKVDVCMKNSPANLNPAGAHVETCWHAVTHPKGNTSPISANVSLQSQWVQAQKENLQLSLLQVAQWGAIQPILLTPLQGRICRNAHYVSTSTLRKLFRMMATGVLSGFIAPTEGGKRANDKSTAEINRVRMLKTFLTRRGTVRGKFQPIAPDLPLECGWERMTLSIHRSSSQSVLPQGFKNILCRHGSGYSGASVSPVPTYVKVRDIAS